MTSLTIALPEDMKAFVESQVARGGLDDPSAYLRALIRREQVRRAKVELEARFREAFVSGPAEPMTREDWDELKRRVWKRHEQPNAFTK